MSKQNASGTNITLRYECNSCEKVTQLQVAFTPDTPLQAGCIPFPDDGQFYCPHCGVHHDLTEAKNDLELSYLETIKHPHSQ